MRKIQSKLAAWFGLAALVVGVLGISIIHVHDSFAATTARLRSVTQLRVFDATGKLVGPALPLGDGFDSAVVAFKVGKYTFPLTVTRDGFQFGGGVGVLFTTANCTGTAYIEVSPNEPFPPFVPFLAVGPKRIYIQDGPFQSRGLLSFLDLTNPGATCDTFAQPALIPVVPAVLLIDNLDTQFIAPFTIE